MFTKPVVPKCVSSLIHMKCLHSW